MPRPRNRPERWLGRQPSAHARARLFCIPYSGCGASMYRDWPVDVEGLEICPVQLPGRENRMREPGFTSYEELADGLIDALLPYFDRPFGFFGHCSSALAAHVATERLARAGYPAPTRLFVSSQVAPHEGPFGRFLELGETELRQEIIKLMDGLGAEPISGLVDLTLEILQGDIAVNRSHRIDAPTVLPCPVTAIGWDRDEEVPHAKMAGWSAYGPATTFEVLEGEHYDFVKAPEPLLRVFLRDLALDV
ncbi:thioesterase II family protein [Streptomyces sp. NPDC008163]|uniref:thioesterase II family protein n=1 Tax=Streptomyces sp. NPDC008163 TaxID=3364818 RepID=UPI0036EF9DCA